MTKRSAPTRIDAAEYVRYDLEVYLDGSPVQYCVVADTAQGYIEYWDHNDQGIIFDPTLEGPRLIRANGTVEIRRKKLDTYRYYFNRAVGVYPDQQIVRRAYRANLQLAFTYYST